MASRVYFLLVAAGGIAALMGCAPASGTAESPGSARDRLYRVLDETQVALGGTWDNQDDPTSRGCVIPPFTEGELYPALRVGPPPPDVASVVNTVTALWRSRGYSVDETPIDTVFELQATGGSGEIAILRVSPDAMTLHGESECRPL
jgi:hypothetical protein